MIRIYFILLPALLSLIASYSLAEGDWEVLYVSTNLTNHLISVEPWPGDPNPPTTPVITTADVALVIHDDYGSVIANVRETNVYVNAIAAQRFTNTLPDSSPIALDIFKYRGTFRNTAVPAQDTNQRTNGQNAHMMIQMWDGSNQVWQANKRALEATVMWSVNAWQTNDYGKVYLYTTTTGGPLELVDTGLTLPVDTNWHTVEFVANFSSKKFVSVTADGAWANVNTVNIARLLRTNWGPELLYHITQESSSAYPGPAYSNIFTWTVQYKDIEFSRLKQGVGFADIPITNNDITIQWESDLYMPYQISSSEDLTTWSNISEIQIGNGTSMVYTTSGTNDMKQFYRLEVVP